MTYLTRVHFTLSGRHAGMTFSEIAVQAATSSECAMCSNQIRPKQYVLWCIQSPVSHTKDFKPQVEADANLLPWKNERLSWYE